jgi:glycosyltransferase involved in cell wall biosynthesis
MTAEFKPIVSIVLPVYNGELYIAAAIDSILEQTLTSFELIIVNDCSIDNTKSIITTYAEKDARIKIINNQVNLKLPASLNEGFKNAKGDLYTWTSDDNILSPIFLQTMVSALQNNANVDLVYSNYTTINAKGEIAGSVNLGDINSSFNNWIGCGAAFLYKKEVHELNKGYTVSYFLIEDYDFFLRAFIKFNLFYIQEQEIYFYRIHESSLSSQNGPIINDLQKFLIEKNLPSLEKKLNKKELLQLYEKLFLYHFNKENNRYNYKKFALKISNHSKPRLVLLIIMAALKGMAKILHSSYNTVKIVFIQQKSNCFL